MEFNNRLYEFRKQKGLSQEELASRVNVSRQTVSKWEIGESAPDMEKLVALSELFDISLDELVLGKKTVTDENEEKGSRLYDILEEKVLTSDNKSRMKKWLKIAGIIVGGIIAIDLISMIVYFMFWGIPN